MNKHLGLKPEEVVPFVNTLLFLIFVIGIFSAIGYGIYYLATGVDYGFLNSTITAYPTVCATYDASFQNCIETKALDSITYKIYADQQYVIASQENSIIRLNNCAIKDRQDWNCTEKNGYNSSQLGFINGKYFDTSASSNIKYVSEYEWSQLPKTTLQQFLNQ